METTTAPTTAPPQPSIIDRWVEALLSGRYLQDKNYLRTNRGYCCMGVCLEVAGYEWGETVSAGSAWLPGLFAYRNHIEPNNLQTIPYHLLDEWGIAHGWQATLTHANDEGATFAQIAEFIKERAAAHELETAPSRSGKLEWHWDFRTAQFTQGWSGGINL